MSIKNNFKLSKGFTLVELLVVIAIIGVLATLLLLQLNVARQRARDAKRIADINQVRTAVELYFDDNGTYPVVGTYAGLANLPTAGSTFKPKYLTQLPIDPLNTGVNTYNYGYGPLTNGNAYKYQLWANLESYAQALKSDADIDAPGQTGWTGQFINGASATQGGIDGNEVCNNPAVAICVYDQGQG